MMGLPTGWIIGGLAVLFAGVLTFQGCALDRAHNTIEKKTVKIGQLETMKAALETSVASLEVSITRQNARVAEMDSVSEAYTERAAAELAWAMRKIRETERENERILDAVVRDTSFTCDSLFVTEL